MAIVISSFRCLKSYTDEKYVWLLIYTSTSSNLMRMLSMGLKWIDISYLVVFEENIPKKYFLAQLIILNSERDNLCFSQASIPENKVFIIMFIRNPDFDIKKVCV